MSSKVCVLDTSAFIHLAETFVGREPLLSHLINNFEVYLAVGVLDELRRCASRGIISEDVNKMLILEAYHMRTLKIEMVPKPCLAVISKEIEDMLRRLKVRGKPVDAGEKKAIGLALLLSRKKRSPIFFLTSDLKALKVLKEIIQQQQIGLALNTLDFLGCLLNYRILKKRETIEAIRHLQRRFTKAKEFLKLLSNLKRNCFFHCDAEACQPVK